MHEALELIQVYWLCELNAMYPTWDRNLSNWQNSCMCSTEVLGFKLMQSGPSVCVFNFCIISALFIHFPSLQGELHLVKLNHMTCLSQWKVRILSICLFKANIFKEFACFFQPSCPFPGSKNGTRRGVLLPWMKFWTEKTRGAQPQSSSPLIQNMNDISCCKPHTLGFYTAE